MHVIIIGGGIAGLTAAAAISQFCDAVTIVEKDSPPSPSKARRYAPQGAHIHILLQAGLNILDKILPGLQQELIDGGSAEINAGNGQQIFEYGAWRPSRHLDMTYLGQSRMHLETTLYNRISSLSNVKQIKGTVEQLELSSSQRVAGIRMAKSQEIILADLVIDASGVGGVFSHWFAKESIANIDIDSFPIHIFYSTIHFKKPEKFTSLKENILIVPEAGVSNFGGSLIDIENDTWCVSLHGRDGEEMPKTIEHWLEIIKNLPDPKIWEMIKEAQALNEITYFKKNEAIWRRFENCSNLPLGYLPLGDAINSLNPIFGQGMTVAIGHVDALFETIKKQGFNIDEGFREEFFSMALEWTSKVWKKSSAFDKNFFSESSQDKNRIELVRKFTAAQHKKIAESEEFHLKVVKESQMLV